MNYKFKVDYKAYSDYAYGDIDSKDITTIIQAADCEKAVEIARSGPGYFHNVTVTPKFTIDPEGEMSKEEILLLGALLEKAGKQFVGKAKKTSESFSNAEFTNTEPLRSAPTWITVSDGKIRAESYYMSSGRVSSYQLEDGVVLEHDFLCY